MRKGTEASSIPPTMNTTIKLGVPDLVTNSYFPALAALGLGCFEAHGLKVEIELVYPHTMDALRDGDIHLAADCAHAVPESFPEWRGARLLMALARGMYWLLVVRADLNLRPGDVHSLAGTRIGAAPGVDCVLVQLLRDSGVDPDQCGIRIGPVPAGDGRGVSFGVAAAHALEAGEIDGFWANAMGAQTAVESGVGVIVLDVRRGMGPARARDYTFSALIASERSMRDNPAMAEAAVRAVCDAQRALRANPELASKVGRTLFPEPQASMIADIVRRDVVFYRPDISEESFRGVARFAKQAGLVAGDAEYRDVVATRFRQLWHS